MYSFEDKEEVIRQFKGGRKVLDMHKKTGIPVDTLAMWKEEADLRLKIRSLIKSGGLEEAKKEVESLDEDSVIRFCYLKKISKLEGDREGEVANLEEILAREPDNLRAIAGLLEILLEEGNRTPKEGELLERLLSIKPKSMKEKNAIKYVAVTIRKLIRESIVEGDLDEEIRLLNELLQINPNDVRANISLHRAKAEKELKGETWIQTMSGKEKRLALRERLKEKTPQVTIKEDENRAPEVEKEILR